MKKHNLLKVLGIAFFVVVLLTWIIPAGSYSNGTFTAGDYNPLGILDWVRVPLSTLTNYAVYAIYILIIGGFYGVMNKTGVYTKLVDRLSTKYKGKEKKLVIITIVFFALLSSITGLNFVLFILVPFFISVLLSLGFSKISSLAATIGAMLIGNIGSIYGFNIVGYINYYFDLNINNGIFTKVILLVILIFLLVMYVLKHNMLTPREKVALEIENKKKEVKGKTSKKVSEIKEEIHKETKLSIPLLGEEKNPRRSYWPLLVIVGFMIVFLIVALYNWKYAVTFEGFENLYESMIAIEVKDFPIIKNILGSFNPLGYWGIAELNIVLIFACLLLGWLYSIKFKDVVDSFVKGAKEMLPVAFYVTLANIIMMVIFGSSSGTSIYYTISNFFLSMASGFNVVIVGIFTAISGLFVNDFAYFVNYMGTNLTAIYTDATVYPLMGIVMQTLHGIMMMIVPTSLLLIAGLSYLNVSYKEWLKYIWKFILEILVICIIIFIIIFLFI